MQCRPGSSVFGPAIDVTRLITGSLILGSSSSVTRSSFSIGRLARTSSSTYNSSIAFLRMHHRPLTTQFTHLNLYRFSFLTTNQALTLLFLYFYNTQQLPPSSPCKKYQLMNIDLQENILGIPFSCKDYRAELFLVGLITKAKDKEW
jgi:hypothetical protein